MPLTSVHFLATDLTVRIFSAGLAQIIQTVMLPALTVSYALGALLRRGSGVGNLAEFNLFVARIALASFMAYLVGQFMDVVVFNRLRLLKAWWVHRRPPPCSAIWWIPSPSSASPSGTFEIPSWPSTGSRSRPWITYSSC